ncbi:MAG TPA: hypothetical protein VM286_01940 [Candidatus Thermoplasmatota archaeon]|nr:hypothetical protein [Candidatus Thermoplasmatota archaeon]
MRKGLLASGSLIVLAIAGFIVLGLMVLAVYKTQETGLPAVSATFQRWDGPVPANQTLHDLDFRAVHARLFLEDHLQTALDHGNSTESQRLRVQQMRDDLTGLAAPDPVLFVLWEGKVVRVVFSGLV